MRVSDNSDATNEIYQVNEKVFSHHDDWQQLALWAFHQASAAHEYRALAKDQLLYPHEVTLDEFDSRMRANLNGADCWSEERAEYESS